MAASFLRHLFATKGPVYAATRLVQVLHRFTFGGRRLDRTISLVSRTLGVRNFPITFFVSSGTLRRHRNRIERLRRLGHDIASHGVYHTRMDLMDFDSQLAVMADSHHALTHAGFPVQGFRSPYLNYNGDTRRALDHSPFAWTSGEVILWKDGLGLNSTVERLGPLYHFQTSDQRLCLPRYHGRILDIPISAPDDEILYERCGVRQSTRIRNAWVDLFDQVHERGELCHLLLHAERFLPMHEALASVIEHVRDARPAVWTPTLAQLADWWKERSAWRWQHEGSDHVKIDAPPGSTILMKLPPSAHGCGTRGEPLFRDYFLTEHGEPLPAWTIGLSPRSPESLENFLHNEGFLAERIDQPNGHLLYLHRPDFTDKDGLTLLEEIDASRLPLLRLWRWPDGHRSAFCISADICAIDLHDFLNRTRHL